MAGPALQDDDWWSASPLATDDKQDDWWSASPLETPEPAPPTAAAPAPRPIPQSDKPEKIISNRSMLSPTLGMNDMEPADFPVRLGDYDREFTRSIPRGLVKTGAGVVRSFATDQTTPKADVDWALTEMARFPEMTRREKTQWFGRARGIFKGEAQPLFSALYNDKLRVGQPVSPEEIERLRGATVQVPVTETGAYKTAQSMENWADETFKQDPRFKESWTSGIGEGVGSVGAFVGAGLLPGIGGPLVGTALGALSTSGEQVKDAVQHRATEQQVQEAGRMGLLPGLTEQAPIEFLLRRVPPKLRTKAARVIYRTIEQAAIEGGQEGVQQTWANLNAQFTYDPERDTFKGVPESVVIGAITGGGLGGGLAMGERQAPRRGGREPVDLGAAPDARKGDRLLPAPAPAPVEPVPAVTPEDRAAEDQLLLSAGETPETIADMNRAERAEALADLRGNTPTPALPAGRQEPRLLPAPGTRTAPITVETAEQLEQARQVANTSASIAQRDAGNHQMAHIKLRGGLNVTVQTPMGAMRTGVDGEGNRWEAPAPGDYGHIKGTKGSDGQPLDILVGPDPTAPNVYVINQIDPKTGKHDEFKPIAGVRSVEEAEDLYDRQFPDGSGRRRRTSVEEMPLEALQGWAEMPGLPDAPAAAPAPAETRATVARPKTFDEAKARAEELWQADKDAGRALKAMSGGGAFGLTPDQVKATPEWRQAKAAHESARANLRDYNDWYTKTFKKEIAADRRTARPAPGTAPWAPAREAAAPQQAQAPVAGPPAPGIPEPASPPPASEAPAGPSEAAKVNTPAGDPLSASDEDYAQMVWDRMNRVWDRGGEVVWGSMTGGTRVPAKARGRLRVKGKEIQMMRGRSAWDTVDMQALTQQLRMPTPYDRTGWKVEQPGYVPVDPFGGDERAEMTDEQAEMSVYAALARRMGKKERRNLSPYDPTASVTRENLQQVVDFMENPADRAQVEAYLRRMRPDVFEPAPTVSRETPAPTPPAEPDIDAYIAAGYPLVPEKAARRLGVTPKAATKLLSDAATAGKLWVSSTGRFMRKRKPATRKAPMSLTEFLIRQGGIAEDKTDRGNLRAGDLHRRSIPFVGKLVRPDGMSLARAHELAVQNGYIGAADRYNPGRQATSTTDELIAALQRDSGPDKVYSDDGDIEWAREIADERAAEREQDEIENLDDADRAAVEKYGYDVVRAIWRAGDKVENWQARDLDAAAEYIQQGMAPMDALEQAAMDSHNDEIEDVEDAYYIPPSEADAAAYDPDDGGGMEPEGPGVPEPRGGEVDLGGPADVPALEREEVRGREPGQERAQVDPREFSGIMRPRPKHDVHPRAYKGFTYYSHLRPIGPGFPIKGEHVQDADRMWRTEAAVPVADLIRLELAPFSRDARVAAVKEAYSTQPEAVEGTYELRDPDRSFAVGLVSVDPQSGKWRLTRFDEYGPSGHSEENSLDDALAAAISSRYIEPAAGTLDSVEFLEPQQPPAPPPAPKPATTERAKSGQGARRYRLEEVTRDAEYNHAVARDAETGEVVLDISWDWDGDDTIHVGNIAPRDTDVEVADIGPRAVLDLLRQLKRLYPDAKVVKGARSSGAKMANRREGSDYQTANLQSISLKRSSPVVEKTDAGQQTVLPGAEQASQKTMAQRAADAPLKPKKAQKLSMDEGLFGDEKDQGALFRQDLDPPAPRRLTPEQRAEVRARIQALSDRILGHNVNLDLVEGTVEDDGMLAFHTPADLGITLGLDDRNAVRYFSHEALHFLRTVGVFTPGEWRIMREWALRNGPYSLAELRESYPEYQENVRAGRWTPEFAEQMLEEEVIAHAFERHFATPEQAPVGMLARIIDKVRRFIEAVNNLARQNGFNSAPDLFDAIISGEIGARQRYTGESRRPATEQEIADAQPLYAKPPRRIPTTPAPSFRFDYERRVFNILMDGTMTRLERIRGARRAFARRARIGLQDRFLDIKRVQDAITRGATRTINAAQDVYQAIELYYGRTGARLDELENDFTRPIIDALARAGITHREFMGFLVARHAAERNAYIASINPQMPDGGSGVTTRDAANFLQSLTRAGRISEFERIGDMVLRMNRQALDRLLANGLITQDAYDAYVNRWQYYVPLRGVDVATLMSMPADEREALEDEGAKLGRRFDIRGPEFKQATGRESMAQDPLAYSILQAQQAIIRSEKNRVGKALLRLAQQNPNPKVWEINRRETKTIVDPATGLVTTVQDPLARQADDVFATKVGGQTYFIKLHHQGLAQAMKGFSEPKMNVVTQHLHKVARVYAGMQTQWNPNFIFTNLMRDIQAAAINLTEYDVRDLSKNVVKDVPAAIRGAYAGEAGNYNTPYAQAYRDLKMRGGTVGFFGLRTADQQMRHLGRLLRLQQPSATMTALRTAMGIGQVVSDVNGAVENAIRLATYKRLTDAGVERDRAAAIAKGITVDFNKRGEWGAGLNALYVFYNASVQGSWRMFQALGRSRNVRVIAAAIMANGALLDWLNRWMADDDDEGRNLYDLIPEHEKERNIIIMAPSWWPDAIKPEGGYFKWSMPYGYNVFHVAGMNAMATMQGAKSPVEAAVGTLSALAGAFNPLGNAPSLLQYVSPTLSDPIAQLYENMDWLGRKIMPENYPGQTRPDAFRAWKTTGEFSKSIAQGLNELTGGNEIRSGLIDISPESIDHVASFLSGGLGRFFMQTGKTARSPFSEQWWDDLEANDIPFLRSFVGGKSKFYDRDTYYRIRDEVDLLEEEIKWRRKQGREGQAEIEKLRRDYPVEFAMLGKVKATEKQLRDLRDSRSSWQASSVDKATKEKHITELEKRMDQAMSGARREYARLLKEQENRP